MQLEHALEVVRAGDEEVRGQDFLEDGADARQREVARRAALPFDLQEGVGHGDEGGVPLPAGQRAPFEVIEAEFVLEFLILLFDRPALMRQAHERPQRRRRGQMHQVVLGPRRRAAISLGEQPDVRGQLPSPPRMGRA